MFDLDQAITHWVRQSLADEPVTSSKKDELEDHLYCEVAEWMSRGYTAEKAFQRATDNLGDSQLLAEAFQQDQGFWSRFLAFEYGRLGDTTPQLTRFKRRLMFKQSMLWAAALISTALVLKGSPEATAVFMLLCVCAFASLFDVGDFRREARCIRRRLSPH